MRSVVMYVKPHVCCGYLTMDGWIKTLSFRNPFASSSINFGFAIQLLRIKDQWYTVLVKCQFVCNRVLSVLTSMPFDGTSSGRKCYGGFAKNRPAAQRPTAHGPRRPSGPAARGPRPTTAQRPSARRPGGPVAHSWFSIVFCPAVNPRACTDLHRVLVCEMDDGEFEFVYHLIIWILVSVCYMLR